MTQVRELGPQDWQLKRDLRLGALLDSPEAFASTYAEASTRDEAAWRDWPTGKAVVYGAFQGNEPVGLAGVDVHEETGHAYLFAMWVAPAARGSGAAPALVDAIVGWARAAGLPGVLLEVAPGNERAARLYQRCGFLVSTDETMIENAVSMRLALPTLDS